MSSGFTPTYQLPYPIQTDPVNVAGDMQDLAEGVESALNLKAPTASPALTGIPTAPTPSVDTNTTQLATTAYVVGQGYLKSATAVSIYAPLASPALTGNPTAPTQTLGNNTTRIATTAFVKNELDNFVTLPSQSGADGSFLTSNGSNAFWKKIQINDVQELETTLNLFAPLNISFSPQSSTSYPLSSGDASRQVEMSNSSPNTLIIPTNASVPFPTGTVILVVQTGTGQTTIAPESGTVTVNGTPGLKLRTQWSVATLVKRSTNTWLVSGDLIQ